MSEFDFLDSVLTTTYRRSGSFATGRILWRRLLVGWTSSQRRCTRKRPRRRRSGRPRILGMCSSRGPRARSVYSESQCGGAYEKPAPRKATRKRKPRQQVTASERTGAQSSKKRKAGSRVKAKNAFKGPGQALNTGLDDETKQKLGTGFRKQAGR